MYVRAYVEWIFLKETGHQLSPMSSEIDIVKSWERMDRKHTAAGVPWPNSQETMKGNGITTQSAGNKIFLSLLRIIRPIQAESIIVLTRKSLIEREGCKVHWVAGCIPNLDTPTMGHCKIPAWRNRDMPKCNLSKCQQHFDFLPSIGTELYIIDHLFEVEMMKYNLLVQID